MSMYPGTGEHCNQCGKVWLYVGDVPPGGFNTGDEPWCTCAQDSFKGSPDGGFIYTEPSIMHTKWCVRCYPHDETPSIFTYLGNSLCEKCLEWMIKNANHTGEWANDGK